jgi:hypothetical protein
VEERCAGGEERWWWRRGVLGAREGGIRLMSLEISISPPISATPGLDLMSPYTSSNTSPSLSLSLSLFLCHSLCLSHPGDERRRASVRGPTWPPTMHLVLSRTRGRCHSLICGWVGVCFFGCVCVCRDGWQRGCGRVN